ncbi:MAG TPA: hypothetical protein VGG83_10785 [Trebonia sp.]|jgi:hypothetical protein
MNALAHLLGLDNLSGPVYGFWSGIGGDASILAVPLVVLRRHNCHVRRCPRLGRHPVQGTAFTVCRKHHPDEHPSADDIQAGAK